MKMAQYSTGGFIVLPGGYGTFEEMMEMITWNQVSVPGLSVLTINKEDVLNQCLARDPPTPRHRIEQ